MTRRGATEDPRGTSRSAMKFGKSVCILNVGGTRYAFPRDAIKDFPLRRVSRLHGCSSEKEVLEVCDDYDRERNEFFFDRHSEAFVFIMLYVKSGKLRFVPRMCELSFYNEMVYWGLESSHLEFCCQRRLDDRMSDSYTCFSEEDLRGDEEARGGSSSATWLERMRRTFEEPTSSVAAQILASVSVVFVIVSMVVLCASTLPDWETAKNRSSEEHRVWMTETDPTGTCCVCSRSDIIIVVMFRAQMLTSFVLFSTIKTAQFLFIPQCYSVHYSLNCWV